MGLQCAENLKKKYPHRNVWVIDRAPLGLGASMRNAGFACFGSMGEILDDARRTNMDEALALYEKRYRGIGLLLNKFGESKIGYEKTGGYEIFKEDATIEKNRILENIDGVNKGLSLVTGVQTFIPKSASSLGMRILSDAVYTPLEGAVQTHLLYKNIRNAALASGVEVYNGVTVEKCEENASGYTLFCNNDMRLDCKCLVVATNGFATELFPALDVLPARGQVLVTSPIPGLAWRGIMHADMGYIYFRSLGTRILIGGARNTDFKTETTFAIEPNLKIQDALTTFLKEVVIPNTEFTIDHSWSGIMGMSESRTPIVQSIGKNAFAAVRMGGMGLALGSVVAAELSELVFNSQS